MQSAGEAFLEFLKTSDHATAIRALVVGGSDGIMRADALSEPFVEQQYDARRQSGQEDCCLVITVQDAGSSDILQVTMVDSVIIRVIDRGRGATNIEALRTELGQLLRDMYDFAISVGGPLEITACNRSGLLYDHKFAAHYEIYNVSVIRGGLP